MKHNPPKAVSLSKCRFHFRMCSAISAAATHSVQRAGLAPGHPVGTEVQGCTRALPAQRLSAQSPQQHPCLQLCNEDPGTAVLGVCNDPDPKLPLWSAIPSERPAKSPQGISAAAGHCSCFTLRSTNPCPPSRCHPKELCSVVLHISLSSAAQPDYAPHTGTNPILGASSNRNSILKVQTSMRPRAQQELPLLPAVLQGAEMPQGHGALLTACQRHPGTHRGDGSAWHSFPQASLCKKEM